MRTITSKESIIEALREELSDNATLADAIDFLTYLQEIEEGLADEEAGRLVPNEEVMREIDQWLATV